MNPGGISQCLIGFVIKSALPQYIKKLSYIQGSNFPSTLLEIFPGKALYGYF
jgi:hypothetical protein